MKLLKKKVPILIITFTLLLCFSVNVTASGVNGQSDSYICCENTVEVSTYLTYFSTVYSNISTASGKILANGQYACLSSGVDVTLLVSLERFDNSTSGWNSVKFWSKTFRPGRGSKMVSGTYSSPPTGVYRTSVTALAITDNAVIAESIKVYSQTVSYP